MSKVITTELQHSGASGANITLDSSKNVTCENNLTVDGTTTLTGAVTLPDDTVDIADLSATGTASSSTFLRGDNAWAAAAGGKLLQIVSATDAHKTVNSSTAVDIYDSNVAITLASTSNKVLCLHVTAYAHQSAGSPQNIESTYVLKRTTSGDTVANLNTGKLRVGSATDINSSIVLLAVDTTFSNLANNYNVTIAYGDGDEAANAYNNTIVLLEIEA